MAVSQPSGYPDGIHAEDPVPAARQELQQLPASGCDIKLLLAHLVRTDLDRVLKEVPGFDIAAVAHEGWQGPPQSSSGIPVVYVGQRGRTLFRLDLESAGGSEPLVDLGAIERARQEAESLDRRIEDTKKQIAAETQRALDQIRTEVADLTLIATSKVTGKVLDRDDQKKLIEDAISELDFSVLERND